MLKTAGYSDYFRLVRKTVESGFSHVELSAGLYYIPLASFSRGNMEEWLSMKAEGVTFSVRLTRWDEAHEHLQIWNPASFRSEKTSETLELRIRTLMTGGTEAFLDHKAGAMAGVKEV